MSKRRITILIGLLCAVVILGGSLFLLLNKSDKTTDVATPQSRTIPPAKPACELFKQSDADALLGTGFKQVSSDNSSKTPDPKATPGGNISGKPSPDIEVGSIKVTACSYQKEVSPSPESAVLISVRSSIPDQTKKDFEATRGANSQPIDGLGNEAYWRSGKDLSGRSFGQLMILKDSNVLAISGGMNNLDMSKKIAEVVLTNL